MNLFGSFGKGTLYTRSWPNFVPMSKVFAEIGLNI